jgi:phenylpropionate dioxygenase-like ring-hydroxylating dioxygenase large terminal subunit
MDTRFLLSPEAYFDDGWYGCEQQLLFARSWHLAASTEELTEFGDVVTIDAGFDPLVVVHGLDGVLRAFHDVCPHRGIKLLEKSGNEGIQATVRSSRFRVGPLAQNHERPITLFHRQRLAALDP